ncbi:MAG: alanine racemase [Candidatus Gracilibacteria bacterium]|nr:alanine racemase [Candidatus Gracilibacteria bacterium]
MKITKDTIPENIENILSGEIESIGVVIPENLEQNIRDFQGVLSKYRFASKIHAVMKVNTSPAILQRGKVCGCRVDVSSLGELKKALLMGYSGSEISANGPKNTGFLELCIEHDVTIILDSLSELETLISLAFSNQKIKILIRLSGFMSAEATRFGVLKEHWKTSIDMLANHRDVLEVLGYSFHIDKRDVGIRKSVFWEAFEYFKLLKQSGFSPKIINIGGGYGVKYHDDTHIKNDACQRSHLGSRLYRQDGGPVGAEFLEKFLGDVGQFGVAIGTFLEENSIELWIEPGRSLMQNSGYGATRIIAIRHDGRDTSLVLDTNSFSLGMREEELPTDPFLLGDGPGGHHEYFLLGNLCLESDIFFCRKVHLGRKAQVGDILIFPDIGAYHIDFYETSSISHPKKSRYFQSNTYLYPDNFS